MNDAKIDDRYLVPALQRGLEVLGQFTRDQRELTGAELARRLELPRASVFRILHTLEQTGFVERVGDSVNYRLGLAVLRLGFEYLASMELTEHGGPVLDALRDDTGLSAHLVVRDGREVVFVAKAMGRSALFNSIQVGARLPAYATVLGRVLMGGLSLADLRALHGSGALTAYTEQTPTTLAKVKELVDVDAARGYGISLGGFESGISTIAAPVFNDQHEVCAAISVTVPSQQVSDEEREVLIGKVRAAANQLTQRISHSPQRSAWSQQPSKRLSA